MGRPLPGWCDVKPNRVRRVRTAPLPPGAVYVGRPTIWGNPFIAGREIRVMPDRRHPKVTIAWHPHPRPHMPKDPVACYRAWLTYTNPPGWFGASCPSMVWRSEIIARLPELRGRNLACWCPLDSPCHADVLLELANDGD